jgi:hypothetical protein
MARRFTSFPAKLRILDRRYPNVAVGVTIAVHEAATARSADMNDLARGQRCVGTMGADPFRSESQGPLMAQSGHLAKCRRQLSAKTRNQPKAKPLDARAVRFSEPRRGYALSLGSALATSRAYLANNSVTS